MDMTLIAFWILFVCKVSVGLKGRTETMRRTSRRTFILERRPERPWAISVLPDLQVRAHDKAQLRCVTSVPASVFSFPFSCFASGVGKRTQPENNRPYLFCCFVTSSTSAKQSLSKLIIFTVVLKNVVKGDMLLGATLGLWWEWGF